MEPPTFQGVDEESAVIPEALPRTDAPNLSECGFDFAVESWGAWSGSVTHGKFPESRALASVHLLRC